MKFITCIILALTKKFQSKLTTSNTDKPSLFETTTSINDSPLVTAFKSFFSYIITRLMITRDNIYVYTYSVILLLIKTNMLILN
jgi:hypothetical protein